MTRSPRLNRLTGAVILSGLLVSAECAGFELQGPYSCAGKGGFGDSAYFLNSKFRSANDPVVFLEGGCGTSLKLRISRHKGAQDSTIIGPSGECRNGECSGLNVGQSFVIRHPHMKKEFHVQITEIDGDPANATRESRVRLKLMKIEDHELSVQDRMKRREESLAGLTSQKEEFKKSAKALSDKTEQSAEDKEALKKLELDLAKVEIEERKLERELEKLMLEEKGIEQDELAEVKAEQTLAKEEKDLGSEAADDKELLEIEKEESMIKVVLGPLIKELGPALITGLLQGGLGGHKD